MFYQREHTGARNKAECARTVIYSSKGVRQTGHLSIC